MARKKRVRANPQEVLRSTFDGLQIVDAQADAILMVRDKHIAAAAGSQKDATNCVLAQACKDQYGSKTVAFFRKTAYVEMPDPKGKHCVVRFKLDENAAAIVEAFDRGKKVKGQVTVTLKAPRPSESLDAIRESSRKKWEKTRRAKRKAILNGVIEATPITGPHQPKPKIVKYDVRNGTGRVHITIKRPSA